eukprot:Nitzschia sp. Nitz4//scaffold217_size45653//13984//17003//NITZ4_007221-RA/size45653-augustus-gene-0.9-mRNA-1//-1//CDS//3329542228//6028//frame0
MSKMEHYLCGLALSFQLFRLSVDFVQTASQSTSKDYQEDHHGSNKDKKPTKKEIAQNEASTVDTKQPNYGATDDSEKALLVEPTAVVEAESSFADTLCLKVQDFVSQHPVLQLNPSTAKDGVWSFRVQFLFVLLILFNLLRDEQEKNASFDIASNETGSVAFTSDYQVEEVFGVISQSVAIFSISVILISAFLTLRDLTRHRFGILARVLHLIAAVLIYIPICVIYYTNGRKDSTSTDETVLNVMGLYLILVCVECFFVPRPQPPVAASTFRQKRTLSRAAMFTMLKPYFWPDETSSSAWLNRTRAMLTWVCVILSKACNLVSPIFLGWASTALAHQQYAKCIYCSITYCVFQFLWSFFKEGQSLIYLKVAQAAFVQLSETTFVHLHNLSLDWHLKKKLGEVVRSVDRGIAACDTLMKFLFLWLLPAFIECIVVCVVFATYFQYSPLAVSVFYFVWFYIVWTILVTLWRKKFRKAVVRSDNEWHERCTDSLINFETVKYFTAEKYEAQRFSESVRKYQQGSVNVQASLSFLNVSQRLLFQMCLAVALSLAAMGIKKRVDCCVEVGGCDSGISDCCQAIDTQTCPGMEVGDFVAVLAYVINLFTPLNFLGTVYNAIVMAIIDLTNLSELLAEDPDVVDTNDAIPLPATNETDPDVAVEFDNVVFHYPSQPSHLGLKGLSFKMKRGTTTAIVGPTGAGKTTVSRLLFRFYDVLGGAVKVNGKDVRVVQQQSLRQAIGAVAQSSSLFSDTIKANLQYGKRDATFEELEQAARDAQLYDFITSLDDGWDTLVGDRGLKLSGGERQRASIARCLLKDPPLVVLDEATSALDTLTENSVQEALDRLGSERTVLVIAHRLGTIRNADNIVVLKEGVVSEEGTHDELMAKNGLYADMWNMQLTASSGGSVVSQL